jgi:hypothetical protein
VSALSGIAKSMKIASYTDNIKEVEEFERHRESHEIVHRTKCVLFLFFSAVL